MKRSVVGNFLPYEVTPIFFKILKVKVALLSINDVNVDKTLPFVYKMSLLSIKRTFVYKPARIVYKLGTPEIQAFPTALDSRTFLPPDQPRPAPTDPVRPHPVQLLFHCWPCPALACKALLVSYKSAIIVYKTVGIV
jgi:hypothetical protein